MEATTATGIFSLSFIFLILLGIVIIGCIYFAFKNYNTGSKFITLGKDIKVIISIWIPILIIELFNFYLVVHRPNDYSEIIFNVTLVIVSLVVGKTLIFACNNNK